MVFGRGYVSADAFDDLSGRFVALENLVMTNLPRIGGLE